MNGQPVPEWMEITPEKAAEFLNYNTHNRTLSPYWVEKFAAEMRAGRWLGGPPIMIYDPTLRVDAQDPDEYILQDGQHRLEAVVRADVSVGMMVHWLPRPVFVAIAMQQPRSLAQVYQTDTDPMIMRLVARYGEQTVAAATRILVMKRALRDAVGERLGRAPRRDHRRDRDFFLLDAESADHACELVQRTKAHFGTRCLDAILCALLRIGEIEPDAQLYETFMQKFIDGLDLQSLRDPIWLYRDGLLNKAFDKDVTVSIARQNAAYERTLLVWNAWFRHQSMERLPRLKHRTPVVAHTDLADDDERDDAFDRAAD